MRRCQASARAACVARFRTFGFIITAVVPLSPSCSLKCGALFGSPPRKGGSGGGHDGYRQKDASHGEVAEDGAKRSFICGTAALALRARSS